MISGMMLGMNCILNADCIAFNYIKMGTYVGRSKVAFYSIYVLIGAIDILFIVSFFE